MATIHYHNCHCDCVLTHLFILSHHCGKGFICSIIHCVVFLSYLCEGNIGCVSLWLYICRDRCLSLGAVFSCRSSAHSLMACLAKFMCLVCQHLGDIHILQPDGRIHLHCGKLYCKCINGNIWESELVSLDLYFLIR